MSNPALQAGGSAAGMTPPASGQAPTPAIRVHNLSKVFRVWTHAAEMLKEIVSGRRRHQEFTALKDVSFEVGRGEIVGIMGRNGAGKSTLLRIIAGTLDTSAGEVEVAGRISAILELGTGFHGEYSGRENITLGGMCLGLTADEIAARQDEIIAFSELGEFIDRPFKTYSSGMQARLTFAVATSIEPDILIIDEALSVGDARFQLKSFDRVRDFKRRGKTILLVSHDINAINAICDRAILLERGAILASGPPVQVSNIYHELLFGAGERTSPRQSDGALRAPRKPTAGNESAGSAAQTPGETGVAQDAGDTEVVPATPALFAPMIGASPAPEKPDDRSHRYGDGRVSILGLSIVDHTGRRPVRNLEVGRKYQLVMDCRVNEDTPVLYCGFLIRDPRGDLMFGSDTHQAPPAAGPVGMLKKGDTTRVVASIQMWLAPGTYFLTAAATVEVGKQGDMWFEAYEFQVKGPPAQHTSSRAFLDPAFTIFPLA